MTYDVGIDLGTTFTAAAISNADGPRMVGLAHDRVSIPSVVAPVGDRFLVGEEAATVSATSPWNVAREFKRRFGDSTPMYINGGPHSPDQLMGELLRWVVSRVEEREGHQAETITVTHPATWGAYKLDLLRTSASAQELPDIKLLAEPTAAALHYHARQRVAEGSTIAVYDLGGGTFDVTLLRRTGASFEIRAAGGLERAGGLDLDDAVFRLVIDAVETHFDELDTEDLEAQRAVARLREECTRAKVGLSYDTRVVVPVVLPGLVTEVIVQRSEFEDLVSPLISDTIEATEAAIARADLNTAPASVLLVGGSSRVPIITQQLTRELGVPVVVDTHPKHAVALGASAPTILERPNDAEVPRQSFFGLDVPPETQEFPEATVQLSAGTKLVMPDQTFVVILTGHQGGRVLELPDGPTVVGRTDGKGVWGLGSRLVSRRHVEFERSGADVTVRDLGSTNGTWVDGRTLGSSRIRLEPGMIVDVAGTLLMLDGTHNPLPPVRSLVNSWRLPSTQEANSRMRRRRSLAREWVATLREDCATLDETAARLRRARRFERPSSAMLELWSDHLPGRLVRPHAPLGTVVLGWASQPSLLDLEIPDFVTGSARDEAEALIRLSSVDATVPFVVPLLGETTVFTHRGPETDAIARSIASELKTSGASLRIEMKSDKRGLTKELFIEVPSDREVAEGRVVFDATPTVTSRSTASVTIEKERATYRTAGQSVEFSPATLSDEGGTHQDDQSR